METSDLDTLLTLADPATSRDDDLLDPLLRSLAADAESAASSRRRTVRRAGVVGALAAAVLGAGGLAQATGVLSLAPEPATGDWLTEPGVVEWTTTLASGTTCEVTFTLLPEDVAGRRLGVDADEWQAVLDAAREVTAGIEVTDIDIDAAAERWRRESDAARRELLAGGMPRAELAPRETPDQVRMLAVAAEIWDRVETELRSRDLPVGALQPGFGDDCPPEELQR